MPTLITEMTEKSSNSELVMELIGILQKEASLFETFLELLEKQQQALVKNDIGMLETVNENQRLKIIEGNALASQREDLTEHLAARNNVSGDISITKLIASVSEDRAIQLEDLKREILDFHERIGTIRDQNEMLINRSRENINKTLELIGNIKAPDGRYHREGTLNKAETSLALDRRA